MACNNLLSGENLTTSLTREPSRHHAAAGSMLKEIAKSVDRVEVAKSVDRVEVAKSEVLDEPGVDHVAEVAQVMAIAGRADRIAIAKTQSSKVIGDVAERVATAFIADEFPDPRFVEPGSHHIDRMAFTAEGNTAIFEVKGTMIPGKKFRTNPKPTTYGRQGSAEWVRADPQMQAGNLTDADVVTFGVQIDMTSQRATLWRRVGTGGDSWQVDRIARDIPPEYYL